VKEVVRNPKMNYWKVPRLGSYMAIPLVYKSVLSVDSFQHAYDDLLEFNKRTLAQEEEKRVFTELLETHKAEKLAANEAFVPEVREWEPITLPAFKYSLKKFVICLDSMG
jgi:hypothetical protein